jgi:hypothetical protein
MEIRILGGLSNEQDIVEMHKNLQAGCVCDVGKRGNWRQLSCANTVTSPAAQTKAGDHTFRQ